MTMVMMMVMLKLNNGDNKDDDGDGCDDDNNCFDGVTVNEHASNINTWKVKQNDAF